MAKNAKQYNVTNPRAVSVVAAAIALAGIRLAHDKHVMGLDAELSAAYSECKTQEAFLTLFGSGGGKKPGFVLGLISECFRERISAYAKDKQACAKNALQARMSEYRKARAKGITLEAGQSAQAALRKAKTKDVPQVINTAAPEVQASGGTDWAELGKTASMEDIANLVSVFIATHPNASSGLVAKLKDFMPVTMVRVRKQA